VGYEVFGGFGIPISPQAQLPGYTPGAVPLRLPKGVGIKLPAGADILMQTHYAPWPVRDSDQSGVNLFFADEPVERYLKTRQMMPFDLVEEDTLQTPTLSLSERLDVVQELAEEFGQNVSGGPGNSGNIADRLGEGFGGRLEGWSLFKLPPDEISRFHGIWNVEEDISLISIYPHCHLLGKSWEIYAINPEGNRENLLKIDSWDFNWQGDYPLPKYLKLNKGSTIHAIATYDNTADNPMNPSMPPKASGWGGKTTDEMYLLGFNYVDYREGDENTSLNHLDLKASEPLPSLQIRQNSDLTYSLIYESVSDSWKIERSDDLLDWNPYSPTAHASANYGYTVMPIVPNGKQKNYFRVISDPNTSNLE
ncbi:MAG: hypothetical protein HN610_02260, partial [Verrucomicrobia bacterium]|nr:hypothetical protein [Verrucomicrobiota bacterium]